MARRPRGAENLDLLAEAAHIRRARGLAGRIVGPGNVNRMGPMLMASEDFSFMLAECPGAYINIGNGAEEDAPALHSARYDFNDEAIPFGAAALAAVALRRLSAATRPSGDGESRAS